MKVIKVNDLICHLVIMINLKTKKKKLGYPRTYAVVTMRAHLTKLKVESQTPQRENLDNF